MNKNIREIIKEQFKDIPLTIEDIVELNGLLRELLPKLFELQKLEELYCEQCKAFEELLSKDKRKMFLELELQHEKYIRAKQSVEEKYL
jgi:hypothetical protein